MENTINQQGAKTSAKDFFLHLGAAIGLYVVAGNFINLLFKIINNAYPEVANNYYYWGNSGSQISLPVATLIIVFPIFIFLSRIVHKSYEADPSKKDFAVRRWLTYITLFVAGVLLAGDLVVVLYKFLDGQDITLAFMLKALVVLLVSGLVFTFYLKDIKDGISQKARNIWAVVVGVIILVSIIIGFSVLGSPRSQRLLRQDDQKIGDLQSMQWQVLNYWQENGMIPEKWENELRVDPQTGDPYQYRKTGDMTFELCATFNRKFERSGDTSKGGIMPINTRYIPDYSFENWDHPAGNYCFSREIDPIAYPTRVRG